MIRAFVAIDLPDAVRDALVAAQAGLPEGRAVAPENLHLTVAFLGEHPGPVIDDVHFALSAVRLPDFDLRLNGLGAFGGDRPRVLYAAVANEPSLQHLREKVQQAARGTGIELGRERFSPHVTLARFGPGLRGEAASRVRAFIAQRGDFGAGPFRVEGFTLWRSYLGRSGPIYQDLARYPLRARIGPED